jgi:hypothetical protein
MDGGRCPADDGPWTMDRGRRTMESRVFDGEENGTIWDIFP